MAKKVYSPLKKFLFCLLLAISFLTLLAGWCTLTASKLVSTVLEGKKELFERHYPQVKTCFGFFPLINDLPSILDGNVFIVLQNNYELRPTGGFMGSYARLKFASGILENINVQDIYVPDGQIQGHVNPPIPIQQAFKQGFWRLRDANWHPDFSEAAEDIAWFFEKGEEPRVDTLVAVNFGLIKKTLEVIGPVKPVDYDEEVTSANFYELAQGHAQEGFFPGSIQKQSYLKGVWDGLFEKMKRASLLTKLKLAGVFFRELEGKEVLLWSREREFEKKFTSLGWDGGLGDYEDNYLYLVESNLGVNKANCCVERKIDHSLSVGEDLTNDLELVFHNQSAQNLPPETNLGGKYVNYLRVIIPREALVEAVVVGKTNYAQRSAGDLIPPLEEDFTFEEDVYEKFKIVGFWVLVPAGEEVSAKLSYRLPLEESGQYRLLVKKQPGLESLPYSLFINGKKVKDFLLEKDTEIGFPASLLTSGGIK